MFPIKKQQLTEIPSNVVIHRCPAAYAQGAKDLFPREERTNTSDGGWWTPKLGELDFEDERFDRMGRRQARK